MGVTVDYDVIVIGAGHAGCEAAHASARLGLSTLVITPRLDRVGWMSCNPAVGGIGKGHLVREVDALGGLLGRVVDETGIQFRTLNTRRGPAVRGSRAQCDRLLYAKTMRAHLEAVPGLELREDLVEEVLVEKASGGSRVRGVRTARGLDELACLAVVVAAGTFLGGVANVGRRKFASGREGDLPSMGLSRSLRQLGLALKRFKTSTTPRLDGRTVDFDVLSVQRGDEEPKPFSHWTDPERFPLLPQRFCHVTRTNEQTHHIVRRGFESLADEPAVAGGIEPRYCPSIEVKLRRFGDRMGHTIYLEPEGLDSNEVYPAGLSTSLPADVQLQMLRTIPGLESVEMTRPGYGIEYDFVIPTQVRRSLEVQKIGGLFVAGQVLGTSGYEEAAAQGLIAGINAGKHVRASSNRRWWSRESLDEDERSGEATILRRDQAYIGVLIDDLTTSGTSEPYRVFTSRAEHRLLLREDNADFRLAHLGYVAGLITESQARKSTAREEMIRAEVERLESTLPSGSAAQKEREGRRTLATILRRPGITYADLKEMDAGPGPKLSRRDAEGVEAAIKYAGYIAKLDKRLELLGNIDSLEIPEDLDFSGVPGLSVEVREKLEHHRPATVGQASRISGVTPAAVEILASLLAGLKRACG